MNIVTHEWLVCEHASSKYSRIRHVHVIVISRAQGLRAINARHPSARDITILHPVGIANMDAHRTLEKQAHLLLKTDTQSRSPIRALKHQSNELLIVS